MLCCRRSFGGGDDTDTAIVHPNRNSWLGWVLFLGVEVGLLSEMVSLAMHVWTNTVDTVGFQHHRRHVSTARRDNGDRDVVCFSQSDVVASVQG